MDPLVCCCVTDVNHTPHLQVQDRSGTVLVDRLVYNTAGTVL